MKDDSKIVLIASAINFILTFLFVNTIGAIASGVYLGFQKNKTSKTYKLFYVASLIVYILIGLMQGTEGYDDPIKTVFVNVFSYLLMALFPVGVAFIVAKINRR